MVRAFTLIELLLVMAIIGLLVFISGPIYQVLQGRNDLQIAGETLVNNFRRAQFLAQGGVGDSVWGVNVSTTTPTITLFKGNTFATRDAIWDEATTLSSGIIPSGLLEVDFARFSGAPNSTGTTTLTLDPQSIYYININSEGRVNY